MSENEIYIPDWLRRLQLPKSHHCPTPKPSFSNASPPLASSKLTARRSGRRCWIKFELAVAALPVLRLEGRLSRSFASATVFLNRPGPRVDFAVIALHDATYAIECRSLGRTSIVSPTWSPPTSGLLSPPGAQTPLS